MLTLDTFTSKYDGKGVNYELFARAKPGLVDNAMFSPVSYHQVLNPIVGSILVNVVDYFLWLKGSAYELFNNFSVTRSSMFPVRVVPGVAILKLRLAFTTTKNLLALLVAFVISKLFETVIANKKAFSRFVVAVTGTKPSSLGGRSSKLFRALFANIFHQNHYSTQCMEGTI